MKTNLPAFVFALPILLSACVTLQENGNGGQSLAMDLPWQKTPTQDDGTRQTVFKNELLKQELIQADRLKFKFETSFANARVTIETEPFFDKVSKSVNQKLVNMTFTVPASARSQAAWPTISKAVNDYARALATNRGSATLEIAMNPESTRKTKPAFEPAPVSVVDIEEGGRLALAKRADPSVQYDTIRLAITPNRVQ